MEKTTGPEDQAIKSVSVTWKTQLFTLFVAIKIQYDCFLRGSIFKGNVPLVHWHKGHWMAHIGLFGSVLSIPFLFPDKESTVIHSVAWPIQCDEGRYHVIPFNKLQALHGVHIVW